MIHPKPRSITSPQSPDILQRRASHPRQSVWVRASAGSGKTKVLADRVVRLLLEGVAPEKILCLTFTRAAAAEMALRVTHLLAKWATCSIDDLRKDLDALQSPEPPTSDQLNEARRLFAKVLACPSGMRIRTIHAFAQEILKRFPLEAGLSPQFDVIDEGEARHLWQEAQDRLLEEIAETPSHLLAKPLRHLIASLGSYKFSPILQEVNKDPTRLEKTIEAANGLDGLTRKIYARLDLSPDQSPEKILTQALQDESFDITALRPIAAHILNHGTKTEKAAGEILCAFYAASLDERVELFDSYKTCFITQKGTPRKILVKKTVDDFPAYKDHTDQEYARLSHLSERIASAQTAQETDALIRFGHALSQSYRAKKREKGVLDYSDLIATTNTLLHKPDIAPWILFKLDGGLDHILVDESQDTNPAQWTIINALAEEFFSGSSARSSINRTLFVVGDEKQSIYSFMGSDPDAFLRMQGFFREKIAQADLAYDEIPINVSFRSAPAILQAVDLVFAQDRARYGVSPDPINHIPFRNKLKGRVEIWPLIQSEKMEKEEPDGHWLLPVTTETSANPVETLSRKIAQTIQTWLESETTIFDVKQNAERLLRPDDIMILVRKRAKIVDPLVRHLKERQIPVTGVDRMILTEQLAVQDLLSLLAFALLPEDDLTLAEVLRTPILNCTDDDLMAICLNRPSTIWSALQNTTNPSLLSAKTYLDTILKTASTHTPFSFFSSILHHPCRGSSISGRHALWRRLGAESQDPIDELLGACERYAEENAPTLQSFMHWISTTSTELKREMEQGGGQVRITTVHAAKGLEAPIVILPDTTSCPRINDMDKVLWDNNDLPFYLPRSPEHSFLRTLRDEAYNRQMQEYRRLLYVALTRPAQRLVMAGWLTERVENFNECWYELTRQALEPVAQKQDDILILEDTAPSSPDHTSLRKTQKEDAAPPSLPAWAREAPRPEPTPPRPLAPSKPDQDDEPYFSPRKNDLFQRGLLIHRLLQSLPDLDKAEAQTQCRAYLENPQHNLNAERIDTIIQETFRLYEDERFAPFFQKGSQAEVPLAGVIGTHVISGRIDRLCHHENEVWILDYKTNRPPPTDPKAIPLIYIRQMASYRAVLKRIYPTKRIRAFLLWTYIPLLTEIEESRMDAL